MVRTALVASVALVLVTGTAFDITHRDHSHPGMHFVEGPSSPDVSVELYPRGRLAEGEPGTSRTCSYRLEKRAVLVPVTLNYADGGAVSIHVTAEVSNLPDGSDGTELDGGVDEPPASATEDFAMVKGGQRNEVYVSLGADEWRSGANDCALTGWTVTPGAWLADDD